MRLFGPAGLFIIGAAIGYAGFVWKGATGRWPLFAGGFAAIALGFASEKLPILLLLMGATTAAYVFESTRGRIPPAVASGLAISDLLLAGAITLFQFQSTRWDLPSPGAWGEATPLIAAAAAIRCAGLVLDEAFDSTGAASLAWWQGALLAWWAGPAPELIVAGLALPVVALVARNKQSVFVIAGGLACVLAGTGAEALPQVAVGAAACAVVLGERVISTWVLAALPLSLVSMVHLHEIGWWGAAGSVVGIAGVSVAASVISNPGGWGGRLIAGFALAAAVASTGPALQFWAYGLVGAGALAVLTTGPSDVPLSNLPVERLSTTPALPGGRWEVLVFTSWVVLGVTALLTVWLLVLGGRTGFL